MMPKGKKFETGFASVKGVGMSYHSISAEMCKKGFYMNHSTARNIFIRAMKKLSNSIISELEAKDADAKVISKSPMFQEAIRDLIYEIE